MKLPAPFGPYELLEKLGSGGMAEVFRARAVSAGGFEKQVAIKRLLPQWRDDVERTRMFLEEARLQARLAHRNLVQAHSLELADGVYFVCLDLVDGADLQRLRGETLLPTPCVLFLAQELLLALDAVHRATDDAQRPLGLVHRDLSPANVLLSRAGEVKLGDFGITKATRLKDETRSGVRKGTYAYMSPEQARGEALTAASDQFALGVLLVELLSGQHPWPATGPLHQLEQLSSAATPALPGITDELRPFLLSLLGPTPSQRFPSALDAYQAARALAAKETLYGPPELAAFVAQQLGGAPIDESTRRTRIDTVREA